MTFCSVCLCLTPAMCHASSCHCYLTLLSGTPSKYQLCTSYCASVPWTPHRDFNIFVVLPWLLSWGFPYFLICFQTLQVFVISRPSHPSAFFSYLGFFPSCLVCAPSSSSQLLTITCLCQHNSLACFQPFSLIPQHPCWRPSGFQLCLFLFSMWLWLTGQRSDLVWVQLISQINAFHAATCLSSCILSSALPLLQFVLLRDKQPQNCIAFPFAVSWNINCHFHAVWYPCPYPVLTVLSHLCEMLCVCFFSAGFSVLKEFTQSYAVRGLFSRVLKFTST